MAASLLGTVAGFYYFVLMPRIHASHDHLVATHIRAFAESEPSLEKAQAFARKLSMQIRFEGANGWSTDPSVPTSAEIDQLPQQAHWRHLLYMLFPGRIPPYRYYVAQTPQGQYLFAVKVSQALNQAHSRLLLWLLVVMASVFLATYLVLRRALRPLRLLGTGVAQLSEGQLDVVVPKQSRDEFGELTDAFNDMARRVGEIVQGREQLLRDVSHELRSPLTRMKVALEMLPEGPQRHSMRADVAEMETMVTELLELERVRDGRGIQIVQHDLVALVQETVRRYQDRPPGVRVSQAPPTLELGVDAEAVRTVLRNVLENAIKFSLSNSRCVEVSVATSDAGAIVRVVDDGPGFPPGDLDRLPEPFYRPDPSRSKRTGGYGLGLSICKRIMDAHRGALELERNVGRGATVTLTFPLRH